MIDDDNDDDDGYDGYTYARVSPNLFPKIFCIGLVRSGFLVAVAYVFHKDASQRRAQCRYHHYQAVRDVVSGNVSSII
jgi:hypothetical protein